MNSVAESSWSGLEELVLRRGARDEVARPPLRSGDGVVDCFGTRERVPFRGLGWVGCPVKALDGAGWISFVGVLRLRRSRWCCERLRSE